MGSADTGCGGSLQAGWTPITVGTRGSEGLRAGRAPPSARILPDPSGKAAAEKCRTHGVQGLVPSPFVHSPMKRRTHAAPPRGPRRTRGEAQYIESVVAGD